MESVSVTIGDDQIWEQRREKMKAIGLINQPQPAKFEFRIMPLYIIMKEGNVDRFIEDLQKYSAQEGASLYDLMHIQGPSGNLLLHVAAGIEKADILRVLLEANPDERLLTKVNYQGDTMLHVAATAGRIDAANLLLQYDKTIARMANRIGNTPLHEAVKNGHLEVIRLLLKYNPELVYEKNSESKSPLYLAVEKENPEVLSLLLEAVNGDEVHQLQGLSPVHQAVMCKGLDLLERLMQKKQLFDLKGAGGGTPLHLAAYMNYVDKVEFLVVEFSQSFFEYSDDGYLPIHVACIMGHLKTTELLLKRWSYPEELVNHDGQNVLHIAAKYGVAPVVKYILGELNLERLINVKDWDGNTPLHVATLHWQPEVLLYLTQDKRVNLGVRNGYNLTALDIVEEQFKTIDAPLRKSLTRIILKTAGAPRNIEAIRQPDGLGLRRNPEPPNLDRLKEASGSRMVVATLIAGVTFAAGFSVPGGYNSSIPDAGIAMLLNKPIYDIFVVCNTVAMYSSITALVILLWTQINDRHVMHRALRLAEQLLLIALVTMSVAFMMGVYVTTSKRIWIAIVTLIAGITALFVILSLFIALFLPLGYNSSLTCILANSIIRAGILISRSATDGRTDNTSGQPEYALRSYSLLLRERTESTHEV